MSSLRWVQATVDERACVDVPWLEALVTRWWVETYHGGSQRRYDAQDPAEREDWTVSAVWLYESGRRSGGVPELAVPEVLAGRCEPVPADVGRALAIVLTPPPE